MTETQTRAWRALVAASLQLTDALERQTQAAAGMPHAYYGVLVALYEEPGRRLRMSSLAERSRMSRSRLTHAVTSMEGSGWVERERSTVDGRGQDVVLTVEGRAAVRRLAPLQIAELRLPLLEGLDEAELAQIAQALEPIAARLAQLDQLAG